MDVRRVPLTALHPDPRNARKHSARNLDAIQASLTAFGQQKPLVVTPTGTILAGNGTWEAARALHWTEIDVTYTTLGDDAGRAYSVADNRTAELAVWDEGELQAALAGLQAAGQPLIGWEPGEIQALGGAAPPAAVQDVEPQLDRAEALREQWGVEVGQLWQCGRHRVLCGDCTEKAVTERLMQGEEVPLCLTDPPYNVGFAYNAAVGDDTQAPAAYARFCQAWFHLTQRYSQRQIVTPGCNNLASWLHLFSAFYVAPWIKTNAMTHGYISKFFCWEPIVFFGGEWFCGDESLWPRRRAHDVFDCPISEQMLRAGMSLTGLHPCPKPMKLWTELLEHYSHAGDGISDPFLGSGTTLIACEQLGRQCYGLEIAPAYVAVTLQRWADLTGQSPTRVE